MNSSPASGPDAGADGLFPRLARETARFRGWRAWTTALGLGILAAAAMPPYGLVFALVPAFTGLVWLAERSRWQGAFAIGWLFGLGHFAVGFYWVASAFLVEAAIYGWMAPIAVIGLAAGMALFPAVAVTAASELARELKLDRWARALALAAFWTLAEWLRGQLFTGFPWNLMGTVWAASAPVLQAAAWVGVFGLGLVTVAAAALPAALADGDGRRRMAQASSGLAVLALIFAAGSARLAGAVEGFVAGANLRLVQPNIPQHLKWLPDLRTGHVRRQIEMSRKPAAAGEPAPTHVIWAETAVPFNLAADRPLQKVLGQAAPDGGLLIAGAPRAAGQGKDQQIWNSAHALTPAGVIVATYDKQHLVPFGEYVPLRQLFSGVLGFAKLTAGRLDFSFGTGPRVLELPGLPPASFLICYEVIFPDEVPGQGAAGRARPGWLLNLTNDAWFGVSAGPHQHLASARMRAVEQGLPLVRVANTGISAVIDGYGRVLAELPLGQAGVIDSRLPKALDATPFARFGEAATWVLILAALALSGLAGRRRRQ
jgi:apolipoprotein N-acyltransferase